MCLFMCFQIQCAHIKYTKIQGTSHTFLGFVGMEVSLSIFYYKYITNTLSKNPAFIFNRDDKVINFPIAEPSLSFQRPSMTKMKTKSPQICGRRRAGLSSGS